MVCRVPTFTPFVLLLSLLSPARAVGGDLISEVAEFKTFASEHEPAPSAKAITDVFQRDLAAAYLSELLPERSSEELVALFDAAHYATFYGSEGALTQLERALEALEARGTATHDQFEDALYQLVKFRAFDRARALYQRAGDAELTAPPRMRDEVPAEWQGPTELVLTAADDDLPRRAVDLSGRHLVVSWHPSCNPSRRAYADIAAHPELSALFARYGRLLALPDSAYRRTALTAWNRAHPDAPVSIMYRSEEWPGIDDRQTPAFHILDQGRVAATIVGWPPEGSVDALLKAARDAGMLEPNGEP